MNHNPAMSRERLVPILERPWAPRPEIAPQVSRDEQGRYVVESNGSAGCYGGWELEFRGVPVGAYVRVATTVRWHDLERGFESLEATVQWLGQNGECIDWEPISDWDVENGWVTLHRTMVNDADATRVVVKLLMRWTSRGKIEWTQPVMERTPAPPPRRIRLGAGSCPSRSERPVTLKENVERFVHVCREAGDQGVNLLCLPETVLSWQLPKISNERLPEYAVEIPGACLEPFQDAAQAHRMAVCFSLLERDGECVFNTGILIDEHGNLVAKYRKVHLAIGEAWSGRTPGDDFGVVAIHTAAVRVGMNICMDSSSPESARIVARKGAEVLLLPIMGDWRAVLRPEPRGPIGFDLERWTLIHRMRALDNQLHLVVARNEGVGSGIFAPDGSILAMNTGETPIVWADVDLNQTLRHWTGPSWRDVTWFQRRESVYSELSGGMLPRMPDQPWTRAKERTHMSERVTTGEPERSS